MDSPATPGDTRIADARADNWVDRFAPPGIRPYLKLARADRPIGVWLLLWPCWWSVALAQPAAGRALPDLALMALFALGALVMRGAGCTWNDIVDRDIDAAVERTRRRPLPSGAVSVAGAFVFLAVQLAAGLAVLLAFNPFTIILGASSLLLVALYPFAKRVTDWPQAVLGLTFNWGALMGYAAVTGTLALAPLLLYAAACAWTLGYDTIYAHQDKEDDALVGVKSSALALGERTKGWLCVFYGATIVLLAGAAAAANMGFGFYLLLPLALAHLAYQIAVLDTDRADVCLRLFKSNRDVGGLVFVAFIAGALSA